MGFLIITKKSEFYIIEKKGEKKFDRHYNKSKKHPAHVMEKKNNIQNEI